MIFSSHIKDYAKKTLNIKLLSNIVNIIKDSDIHKIKLIDLANDILNVIESEKPTEFGRFVNKFYRYFPKLVQFDYTNDQLVEFICSQFVSFCLN